jgi:iron complex outermembrane recepter protein
MTETTPVQVLRDTTSNGGNPVTFVTPAPGTSIVAEAQNKSESGFGELDTRFTDLFELDLGVRYSKDTQDYTRTALPGPPPPGCFPCTNTAESSQTTGKVGAKFFVSDGTMLYATASKGYKAGGVNLDPRLDVFGPETNTVGELGFKTTMVDGRLRINGDVFYSDYKDIQISALVNLTPTVRLPSTVNGPAAKTYGGEVEMFGQFDALAFNLGVSILHTETTEARTMTNSSVSPSVDALVASGTELPFSPTATLTAGIEYAVRFGNQSLTPRLQVAYMAEQWATFFHDDNLTKVPARTIADFRLTYAPIEHLQIEAFVSNLFDETYIAVQVQDASSAAGGQLYGAPRQIGGRIKYSF